MNQSPKQHDYLRRLETTHYTGEAWVHWSLTMDGRSTGWLSPSFHYHFRELLTHACFRHRLSCLVYCLMPDHVHMLWHGLTPQSNQLSAMAFFRKRSNESLGKINHRWQNQAYERVLRESEIEQDELQGIVEYIARNPERAGLVDQDAFGSYRFTGCLLPGYPELRLFQEDSWTRIWRAMSYLKRTAVFTQPDPKRVIDSPKPNSS